LAELESDQTILIRRQWVLWKPQNQTNRKAMEGTRSIVASILGTRYETHPISSSTTFLNAALIAV
jgi:hypothetical protein